MSVLAHRRRLVVFAVAVAVVGVVVYHSWLAARMVYPGNADNSYYYGLAKGLREGRGFHIDYTWHYLNVPRSVQNLPNDFWMPLPSILMATAFLVFGTSVSAALVVCLIAWLGTAALAGLACRRLTGSSGLGMAAAAGTVLLPDMLSRSFATDGSVLLALFGMSAVVAVLYARGRPWCYAVAGACVALAQLSRQDGMLFGATVCVGIVVLSPKGHRLRQAGAALLAYGVVIAPLVVGNLSTFGAPLPPGPRKAAFLTEYEDLYSYGRLSAEAYLATPLQDLIQQRLSWFPKAWRQLHATFGGPAPALVVIAATVCAAVTGPRRREWLVGLTFPIVLVVFHSLVLPVSTLSGGWARSFLAAAPFFVVGLVSSTAVLVRALRNGPMEGPVPALAAALVVLMVVSAVAIGAGDRHQSIVSLIDRRKAQRAGILAIDRAIPTDGVVMTRHPWELSVLTGRRTVQIPNDDIETILRVACMTDARYLIADKRRPALRHVPAVVASGRMAPVPDQTGIYALRPC